VRAHSNYHGFGVWVGHQRSAVGIGGFLLNTNGLVIFKNVAEIVKARHLFESFVRVYFIWT
jgi:hypothetical protein